MDAKTLFNEKLPQIISTNPEKAKEVGAIYQFNITGDGGGSWTVNLKDDLSVTEGQGEAECTIEVSTEDFAKIAADPQGAGMQLFFEGKLKVEGDPMLATKLAQVLELAK
jgi:putative sterol carrier protein